MSPYYQIQPLLDRLSYRVQLATYLKAQTIENNTLPKILSRIRSPIRLALVQHRGDACQQGAVANI